MQPKRYRAYHITPGLVDYVDGNRRETVLIRKPALDRMNRSFLGKPVFNFAHKTINSENAFDFENEQKEELAAGIISDVGYDAESGYYWADMMIWDPETQDNIDNKGFGVSNAYIPEVEPGGVYNNVPYDEEVIDGEYHHLAIVEDPRYGDVKIFENSKTGKPMKFKLFKKKPEKEIKKNQADMPPEDDKKKKDEPMPLNADSVIVDENGNEIPISELVDAYKKSKGDQDQEKPTLNMEDTIDIDGEEVPIKNLYDNYCSKKNAEPPTDEPLEPVVDESLKKNSAGSDKNQKEKPNDNFQKLKLNANRGAEPEKIKVNTEKNRLELGKVLYGSDVSATVISAHAQGGR